MGGRGVRVIALDGFDRAHWAGVVGRGASSSREKKVDWYGHSSSFSERDVVDCDAEWIRYTILDGLTEGIPASSLSMSDELVGNMALLSRGNNLLRWDSLWHIVRLHACWLPLASSPACPDKRVHDTLRHRQPRHHQVPDLAGSQTLFQVPETRRKISLQHHSFFCHSSFSMSPRSESAELPR